MRGASIYTLSEQASERRGGAACAARRTRPTSWPAPTCRSTTPWSPTILIDLAQRDTNNKSIAFADMHGRSELATVTPLAKRRRRFAGFAVLKSPDMPSVLLELGYLSNPDEQRNLAQTRLSRQIGQAIVRALDRLFRRAAES